jgi:hypothetical protein
MRWPRELQARKRGRMKHSRTAKPCGPDAPTLASSSQSDLQVTVARKPGHRGERGVNRKTIAQGRPDCLRFTCMLVCAFLVHHCTRDRGCSAHPVFPAPSSFLGRVICKPRTHAVARMRRHVSHPPLEGEGRIILSAAKRDPEWDGDALKDGGASLCGFTPPRRYRTTLRVAGARRRSPSRGG